MGENYKKVIWCGDFNRLSIKRCNVFLRKVIKLRMREKVEFIAGSAAFGAEMA
jgi:hypothetical protein